MPPSPSASACSACGAAVTVYDRVCDCGALVNATTIAELRTRARIGQMARDPQMAIGALQRALQLVPEDHPEHAALSGELDALLTASAKPEAPAVPAAVSTRRSVLALVVIAACLLLLLLWPLLSGSLGGAAPGAGAGRHPARGALYPPP